MEGQYLENVRKGMKVEILSNQNKLVRGIVDEVLSKSSYQMYGMMVRLLSGEIGRVQKIILDDREKNQKSFEEVHNLIFSGESLHVEFKSSSLWSADYTNEDIHHSKSYEVHTHKQKASKVIIAKSIAAFLNSDGGNLVIGVKEKKDSNEFELVGIQDELKKLTDPSRDGYKRMIIDDILRSYFPSKIYNHLNDYLRIDFVETIVNESVKLLCWIRVKRSDQKVFLKLTGKEVFMIRTDSQSRAIEGEELVDYCIRRFK